MSTITSNIIESHTLAIVESQDNTRKVFEKTENRFHDLEQVAKEAIVTLTQVNTKLRVCIASAKSEKSTLETTHQAGMNALKEKISQLKKQLADSLQEEKRLETETTRLKTESAAVQTRIAYLQSPAGQNEAVIEIQSQLLNF